MQVINSKMNVTRFSLTELYSTSTTHATITDSIAESVLTMAINCMTNALLCNHLNFYTFWCLLLLEHNFIGTGH